MLIFNFIGLLEVVVPVVSPELGEGPGGHGDVGAALALGQAPLLPLHHHAVEALQHRSNISFVASG